MKSVHLTLYAGNGLNLAFNVPIHKLALSEDGQKLFVAGHKKFVLFAAVAADVDAAAPKPESVKSQN